MSPPNGINGATERNRPTRRRRTEEANFRHLHHLPTSMPCSQRRERFFIWRVSPSRGLHDREPVTESTKPPSRAQARTDIPGSRAPVGRFGREFGWWATGRRGGAAAAPARVGTRRRDRYHHQRAPLVRMQSYTQVSSGQLRGNDQVNTPPAPLCPALPCPRPPQLPLPPPPSYSRQ